MLNTGELVIDDGNFRQFLSDTDYLAPDGTAHRGYGLVPRATDPDPAKIVPMRAVNVGLIPRSEWSPRAKQQAETQTRTSDFWRRSGAKFLDQGPVGYCWGHGTVHAVMASRVVRNMPYVPLSAFGLVAPLVNGRDEGGWGGWSLEQAMKVGIPDQAHWPQGNRDMRLWTPECRQNAGLYKVTGAWMDLNEPKYDRNLTVDQFATLLLNNTPVVIDLNWWGHCIVAFDWVEIEAGHFGPRILNSWRGWGDEGMAVLSESKGVPDNAVAPGNLLAA